MINFAALLEKKQAELADPTTQKAAALPASFEEHKFSKKDKDDDKGEKEEKGEKGEKGEYDSFDDAKMDKKAAQTSFNTFADSVLRLTEKTAAIVAETHNVQAEQLFRNMISSCMNFKLAGVQHEAFETPETLISQAYDLMEKAADLLEVPLT